MCEVVYVDTMPPKRRRPTKDSLVESDGASNSKPVPKKSRAAKQTNKRSMPKPIPAGTTLTDLLKKQWVLGKSVGKGGFGEIYQATVKGRESAKDPRYVIKVVSS